MSADSEVDPQGLTTEPVEMMRKLRSGEVISIIVIPALHIDPNLTMLP